MDSGKICVICQNHGHSVGKCPELGPNAPPPSGGGGGHSHDDDDERANKQQSRELPKLFTVLFSRIKPQI